MIRCGALYPLSTSLLLVLDYPRFNSSSKPQSPHLHLHKNFLLFSLFQCLTFFTLTSHKKIRRTTNKYEHHQRRYSGGKKGRFKSHLTVAIPLTPKTRNAGHGQPRPSHSRTSSERWFQTNGFDSPKQQSQLSLLR